MSWLWSLLAWIAGKLFGNPSAPTPDMVEGEKAGAASATGAQAVQAENTNAAIAQAAVDAPKDQASVVSELNKGTF